MWTGFQQDVNNDRAYDPELSRMDLGDSCSDDTLCRECRVPIFTKFHATVEGEAVCGDCAPKCERCGEWLDDNHAAFECGAA